MNIFFTNKSVTQGIPLMLLMDREINTLQDGYAFYTPSIPIQGIYTSYLLRL